MLRSHCIHCMKVYNQYSRNPDEKTHFFCFFFFPPSTLTHTLSIDLKKVVGGHFLPVIHHRQQFWHIKPGPPFGVLRPALSQFASTPSTFYVSLKDSLRQGVMAGHKPHQLPPLLDCKEWFLGSHKPESSSPGLLLSASNSHIPKAIWRAPYF